MKDFLLFFFICIFINTSFSQEIQDYSYLIDNRIQKNRRAIDKDSLDHMIKNQYVVNFNLNFEIIRENFNPVMKKIRKNSFLDSIIVSNHFGKMIPEKIIIYVGYDVPFQLSKIVISHFYDKYQNELKVIQQYKMPEDRKELDLNLEIRKISIGGFDCPYSAENKYLTDSKDIQRLLDSKTQKEFNSIFREYDEHKDRFLKHLEFFDKLARYSGCESIDDIELRRKCAQDKLHEYLKTNLDLDSICYNYPAWANIEIDEKGNIIECKVWGYQRKTKTFMPESCEKMILRVLKEMPNWIPAKRDNIPVKSKVRFTVFSARKT